MCSFVSVPVVMCKKDYLTCVCVCVCVCVITAGQSHYIRPVQKDNIAVCIVCSIDVMFTFYS